MGRTLLALVITSNFGIAHVASAADLPVKAPPRAPAVVAVAYNWTGFYIGGNCGGAWARSTTNNTAPFAGFDNGVPTSYTLNDSGWTCGGQFGYNWQTGQIVFGLEGDIGYLGINRGANFNSPVGDVDFVSVKYSWYGTATGRLGMAWDRSLLYAKGGLAYARVRNEAADTTAGVIDQTDFAQTTKTRLGWAAGAGWEYGWTPQWSIKVEYLYMDFGKFTSNLNADGNTFEHRNRVHTAKFGINYRWGGGPVVARY
jgi:outer membrane immunogenic protein